MTLAYEKVTRLISRSLGIDAQDLVAAFKPAEHQDVAALLAFRQEYLGKSIAWDDLRYLEWRYDFSPFDTTNSIEEDTSNRYWILKLNGEICGAIGFDHVNLMIMGKISPAKNPLDLLVKSELDGLGLGVWMSLNLQQRYPLMFAMGATRYSQSIVKKLFQPMPDIGTWKILLDTETYIQRYVKVKPIARGLAKLMNIGLRCVRFFCTPSSDKSVVVEQLIRFNTDRDEVELLEQQINNQTNIFRHRCAQFLNWRFIDNPRRGYYALAARRGENLSGYAVYRVHKKRLHIADWFCASNDAATAYALLAQILKTARQQQVSMVLFVAQASSYSDYFENTGFRWRNDGHLFSVFTSDMTLQPSVYNPNNWMVTEIDMHNEGY